MRKVPVLTLHPCMPSTLQPADLEAPEQQIAAVHAAEQPTPSISEAAGEEELPKFANNPAREFQLLLGRVSGGLQCAVMLFIAGVGRHVRSSFDCL